MPERKRAPLRTANLAVANISCHGFWAGQRMVNADPRFFACAVTLPEIYCNLNYSWLPPDVRANRTRLD